jgi:hypothetical protein
MKLILLYIFTALTIILFALFCLNVYFYFVHLAFDSFAEHLLKKIAFYIIGIIITAIISDKLENSLEEI